MKRTFVIAYYRYSVLDVRLIERFVGSDPIAAEEAFTSISKYVERFLLRYLTALVPNEQDRQDAIHVVLERLWTNRTKIEARGVGAWWSYVARAARWAARDRSGKPEAVDLSLDIPDEDVAFIDVFEELNSQRILLYRMADELWLCVEPEIDEAERSRRLLAAQLHFLHSRSWEEIAEIIGLEEPITRATFDSWLESVAALLEMSFRSLHVSNEVLAGYILRPQKPLTPKELQDLWNQAESMNQPPLESWSWDEVRVIVLKFRNGLPDSKIAQMTGFSLDTVEGVVAKCRKCLPFESNVKTLKRAFRVGRAAVDPLISAGVWKRLVFQYHVASELPQKHILELVGPAAQTAGYSLTSGMLNVWLSNGRLFTQLANYVAKRRQSHGIE